MPNRPYSPLSGPVSLRLREQQAVPHPALSPLLQVYLWSLQNRIPPDLLPDLSPKPAD